MQIWKQFRELQCYVKETRSNAQTSFSAWYLTTSNQPITVQYIYSITLKCYFIVPATAFWPNNAAS